MARMKLDFAFSVTPAYVIPDSIRDQVQLLNFYSGFRLEHVFAGYTVSVPVLAGLTDRMDPRRIYLGSTVLGIAGALGFALLANGFWTALVFRVLAGFGLAGTFPGFQASAP